MAAQCSLATVILRPVREERRCGYDSCPMLVPFWAQLAPVLPMMCRTGIGMDLAAHPADPPKGESDELTVARTQAAPIAADRPDERAPDSVEVGVVRCLIH